METTVGGLRAVEMTFRGIREIDSGNTSYFQSSTLLNTPELGALPQETFRGVAELSKQCITLFELELTQCIEAINYFQGRDFSFKWVSVYMPLKFLEESNAETHLTSLLEDTGVDTSRICFELSQKVLTQGTGKQIRMMENLRNRGYHFMLTDFGGVNCPLMRLSGVPVDYVMLSPENTAYLGAGERAKAAMRSLVDFITRMEAEAIADGVSNIGQVEALFEADCHYIAGPLSGKFSALQYVRKKTDSLVPENKGNG